jgi:hypothetical protein
VTGWKGAGEEGTCLKAWSKCLFYLLHLGGGKKGSDDG